MDQETLFTAAKWDILKSLSQEKNSPMDLAKQNNTSVSNISQSLRFLELGGIVKSERVSNRDKGQPRVVYSLFNDKAFIIVTADNFAEKKLVDLDNDKKAILRIWFHENKNIHSILEKAYAQLKSSTSFIEAIYLDNMKLPNIELVIVTKEKAFKEPRSFTDTAQSLSRTVSYKVVTKISEDADRYYPIHIPQIIKNIEEEKT